MLISLGFRHNSPITYIACEKRKRSLKCFPESLHPPSHKKTAAFAGIIQSFFFGGKWLTSEITRARNMCFVLHTGILDILNLHGRRREKRGWGRKIEGGRRHNRGKKSKKGGGEIQGRKFANSPIKFPHPFVTFSPFP